MLVLSRRPQQSLLIGHDVVVTVLEVNGDTVRIGIKAPADVDIHREEIYRDLQRANQDSSTARPGSAAALARRMQSGGKASQDSDS
ncbi:carbon storage regulator CsrA [Gephyromycinifex aptenodytis]|uniref:carbon storage regulator CsrA n=1 Tax=Gephyromycinifex aptenodytis TaxID=2716227 RepID=UPI001445A536|nr:carbon storage regulator CsrA [Gephyromycinifex aptenodytis]